jgi:glycosyltransferase involved in cell wall biosynthesis
MNTLNILFIVPCIPYFPSGIVRVKRYFSFLEQKGIHYQWINLNAPRVQRWLEWLDLSWFGRYYWTDLAFRAFVHATGIPHRWFHMLQILWFAKKVDIIFFQSTLTPIWYINLLSRLNPHLVFDYDDALYVKKEKQTQAIIQASWKVFAASHVLFDYAKLYNANVILVPSCIPIKDYVIQDQKTENEKTPLRIGWVGSTSTLEQLQILEEPFKRLLEEGYQFEFLVAGTKNLNYFVSHIKGIQIIDIPTYTDEEIPDLVNQIDIGVMPLYNSSIEQGKGAFKLLIYMAGQIPVVCSPVGEANFLVTDNLNGFFADSVDQWVEKLGQLLKDKDLRNRMGMAGRKTVEDKFMPEFCFQIINREIIEPLTVRK